MNNSPVRMPRKGVSLRENFAWTLAGNLTYAVAMWLLFVLLARLADPEAVGRFALGLAIATPVFLLTSLNLRVVEATDVRLEYSFRDYLLLRLWGVAAGMAISIVIALVLNRGWSVAVILLLVATLKAIELLSDIYFGLMQQHDAMQWIGVSQVLRGATGVVAFAAALRLGAPLWLATALLALSFLAVLLLYDVPHGMRIYREAPARLKRPADQRRVLDLFRVAIPMGLVTAFGGYSVNAPRYAIEAWCGTRELGIFAALASIVLAGNTVIGALAQAATPRLARLAAAPDARGFRQLLVRLQLGALAIGALGIAAALAFGSEILLLVFGAEYAKQTGLFAWLMTLAAVMYVGSFLGTAVTALRRFRVQARIHAANGVLVTLCAIALVPRFGLNGAAWSLIAGAVFVTIAFSIVARQGLAELSSAKGASLHATEL